MQTWDHKQPERAFYSYYHAHHLNKCLFQTQQYLGTKLIHRLHVLNPLTNTDIIGNVLYFMVVGRSPRAVVSAVAAVDQGRGVADQGQGTTTSTTTTTTTPGAHAMPDDPPPPWAGLQSPTASDHDRDQSPGWRGGVRGSRDTDRNGDGGVRSPLRIQTATGAPATAFFNASGLLPVPPSPSVRKLPAAHDPVTLNRALHHLSPTRQRCFLTGGGVDDDVDVSEDVEDASTHGWTRTSPVTATVAVTATDNATATNATSTSSTTSPRRLKIHTEGYLPRGPPPLFTWGGGRGGGGPRSASLVEGSGRTTTAFSGGGTSTTTTTTTMHGGIWSAGVLSKHASRARNGDYPMVPMPGHRYDHHLNHDQPYDDHHDHHQEPVRVPAGTLTQHGRPVSQGQAESTLPRHAGAHSRRRSLSYMNSLGDGNVGGGVVVSPGIVSPCVAGPAGPTTPSSPGATATSLDEWKTKVRADRHRSPQDTREHTAHDQPHDNRDRAKTPPGPQASIQKTASSLATAGAPTATAATTAPPPPQPHQPPPSPPEEEETFYDAVLIATDNDFLETSRVRALFREHAVTADDWRLFEMPPVVAEVGVGDIDDDDIAGYDDTLCDYTAWPWPWSSRAPPSPSAADDRDLDRDAEDHDDHDHGHDDDHDHDDDSPIRPRGNSRRGRTRRRMAVRLLRRTKWYLLLLVVLVAVAVLAVAALRRSASPSIGTGVSTSGTGATGGKRTTSTTAGKRPWQSAVLSRL